MQRNGLSTKRFCPFVFDRGITLLRLGLHRDLFAEGRGDRIVGAQMHKALIAVHHNVIAGQRLGCDPVCMHDQRDRQGAGHNRRMRSDRSFFQHNPL